MDNKSQLSSASVRCPRSIIGPPATLGNHVIVDARIIPHLTASESADGGIEIVLDRRFAITVSADDAHPVA